MLLNASESSKYTPGTGELRVSIYVAWVVLFFLFVSPGLSRNFELLLNTHTQVTQYDFLTVNKLEQKKIKWKPERDELQHNFFKINK